jgi:transcription termination factor Rho
MAEANEQPALLGEDAEPGKKPRRTRSAPGSNAKRTPTRKGGGKRPVKSNDHATSEPTRPGNSEVVHEELPLNEATSQVTATAASARNNAAQSVAGIEAVRATERSGTDRPAKESPELNESREVAPGENGRHRVSSEITVEQARPEPVYGEGLIEVSGKGFGFLRDPKRNYVQSPQDIFVTPEVVRKHALRDGLWIKGEIRRGSRGPQLFKLTEINGEDPDRYRNLPVFEELTSINPVERIRLETVPDRYTTRVMDLMTPIGKGQRGLIVAPPRTGKTTLLQHIADAVVRNHPETSLIILLVDERPEEVTEIRRTVPKADIMASSNDSDIKSHTRIAQLAIERAKRLVEANRDVFVLMDSLTRVGRAFNNASAGSGRTMSGGMDSRAMEIPRKLFAAARNTEEAGSLTIMATALIETGSKMDELIFQEFKGTGNMEMVLDRQISDQRTYPSVDIFKSGTRREELLLPERDLEKINTIRRGLAGHRPTEAIERLLSFLRKFPTNAQMLREIPR